MNEKIVKSKSFHFLLQNLLDLKRPASQGNIYIATTQISTIYNILCNQSCADAHSSLFARYVA
jgi:hypothetical protein